MFLWKICLCLQIICYTILPGVTTPVVKLLLTVDPVIHPADGSVSPASTSSITTTTHVSLVCHVTYTGESEPSLRMTFKNLDVTGETWESRPVRDFTVIGRLALENWKVSRKREVISSVLFTGLKTYFTIVFSVILSLVHSYINIIHDQYLKVY